MSTYKIFAAIAISLITVILLYLLATLLCFWVAHIGIYKSRTPIQEDTFIGKWNAALKRQDREELEEILSEHMASCTVKNTYCGTELFCPDCPHGGLVVMSGRHGL